MSNVRINAEGLHYKKLNEEIHKYISNNKDDSVEIVLENVCGQRYIAAGLKEGIKIVIEGTAGNDLGVFMDGAEVFVKGNAQDAMGNTMNSGRIVVDGSAGDVIGYGMRGGCIYIKKDAGYRVGIHMKAYEENFPVIVVGGSVGDFLGEYMAGGVIIVLGLWEDKFPVGDFIGTGMHGGNIYIRAKKVDERLLGKEVKISEITKDDFSLISKYISNFCSVFSIPEKDVVKDNFVKLYPYSSRPYGRLYAY